MRLLLVPYYFAPAGGPRSIRWTNLARYMVGAGHQLTVVAADFPGDCPWMDPSLLEVVAGLDIEIHRLPIAQCSPNRKENVAWMQAARRLIDALPTTSFDAVISSAVPIASHGVVSGLPRLRGTPWIADYGDPWSQSASRIRRAPVRWLETVYERRLLRRADAITVTTPAAMAPFAKVVSRPETIRVIPQGASYFHLQAEWLPPKAHDGPLRVLYAGGFYAGVRGPEALLAGLAMVPHVELTLVGHSQMDLVPLAEAAGVGGRVHVRPYADIREIVKMQQEADLLLLLSWPVAEQIPGKFWEYLVTSRRILYATYRPDDEVSRILREKEAGDVVGASAEAIAGGLAKAVADWHSGQPFGREPDRTVGFDARAAAFVALIEQIKAGAI